MTKSKDCFFCWLTENQHIGYDKLRAHAEANNWPRVYSLAQAWGLIGDAAALSDNEKADLKQAAALAYVDFERVRSKNNTFLGLNAFGLGVFLFMAATLGILALAIFEPVFMDASLLGEKSVEPLLTRLADVEAARGLITFVFTVGVIALALIIVTANVTSNDEGGVRFERSKEILTSLIAIMGTILGFYFGKADTEPVEPVPTEKLVADDTTPDDP